MSADHSPLRSVVQTRSAFALSIAVGLFVLGGCGSDAPKNAADSAASVSSVAGQPSAATEVDVSVASSVVSQTTPEASAVPSAPPQTNAVAETSSSVAAGADDPCRLITPAEAEAALGMPVRPAVIIGFDSGTYGHGSDCSYSSVDQSAGPTTVHIGVLGEGFPRELWEQQARAEPDSQEVPGLGDIAFFIENDHKIAAFVGGRWVEAQMINTNESELLADLTEIVRIAIERL